MFRTTRRYAVRSLAATAVGAMALALAAPSGAVAGEGAPDPQWGANQARPTFEQSPTDGNPDGPALDPAAPGATVAPEETLRAAGAGSTSAAAPSWVLRGAGWGHGIGLSQYGAFEMAKAGYTAPQILKHYYSGTTYDAVTDSQTLDVNILYHVSSSSSVTASTSALASGGGAFQVYVAGDSRRMTGTIGDFVSFSMSGTTIKATCSSCTGATSLAGTTAILAWDTLAQDKTLLKIGGAQYRDGTIRLTPSGSAAWNVVNRVRLHDEYLDYIAESPWSWRVEALKAQAAAARGYAMTKFNAGLRQSCDCHVFDTTADQVYGGYSTVLGGGNAPYWANWRNAVRATGSSSTGYVSRSRGAIIQAFFSSSSGGRTENNEDVWNGTPLPYLRGVQDPWSLEGSNPARDWRQVASGPSLARAFGLGDVARLDLSDRTANGGVRTATATSSGGAVRTVTGDQVRTVVASGTPFSGRVNSTMIRHLTGRLAGPDRYASAAAVAARVPASADAVVLAAADGVLVDASVSGPLAATVGGPLLLTRRGSLPPATVAELNRRGKAVRTAYVIGSEAVVSQAVVAQLTQRGIAVQRLGGSNRFATSALVAKAIRARRAVPTVVIAGGEGLPDALGASGPASALREPILLTPATRLDSATRSALTATGATSARIVGGEAVVSSTVQDQLKDAGVTSITRLGGDNRYAVSAAVASFYRSRLPVQSEIVVTAGLDASLVDSLVAGTLQRLVVLTKGTSLGDDAEEALQRSPLVETLTAVGGTSAVSARTLVTAANS
ncbi:MAG: SpoIID/LytB domain-containing protein [Pedococcus sp.]